jgi:hypothetical protein
MAANVQLFAYFFLAFIVIITMINTKSPTRKKAHHIPALKIVSTTPQLLNVTNVKRSIKSKDDVFIIFFEMMNSKYYTSFELRKDEQGIQNGEGGDTVIR